ncbi:MAG: hypothetical protein RLZZ427_571 [Pseudomonadota bacterium]|jgi:hypothetical protein
MRNSLRIAAVGAALAAASLTTAANAAATATATAEVLNSLTLAATGSLEFGQLAANSGGTVIVNANSTVSQTGGLVSNGTRTPAAFSVTGSPNALVTVSLPTSAATLTRAGGAETMTLDGFNTNPNGAFQLDGATGAGAFTVGGTLHVASGQVPGTYSGTFSVSVEYQ